MSRTAKLFAFAVASLALSMACTAQSPTIVAQKVLDQYDQSWANHNVNQTLSFLDPSFTDIDANGKQVSFADFRKTLMEIFNNPDLRNFTRRSKIKDAQLQGNRVVVYFDTETRYQHQRAQVGWEPYISTASSEVTLQKSGDQWRIVTVHVLRQSTTLDPQYAASRQQQLQNNLRAIQRAGDQRACTYSYNGC